MEALGQTDALGKEIFFNEEEKRQIELNELAAASHHILLEEIDRNR